MAQGDGFDGGLHHVFRPAKGVGQQAGAHRGLGAGSRQSKRDRVGGVQGRQERNVLGAGCGVIAQPLQQRAAHLLSLGAQLGALAGLQNPSVQAFDLSAILGAPGRYRLG